MSEMGIFKRQYTQARKMRLSLVDYSIGAMVGYYMSEFKDPVRAIREDMLANKIPITVGNCVIAIVLENI